MLQVMECWVPLVLNMCQNIRLPLCTEKNSFSLNTRLNTTEKKQTIQLNLGVAHTNVV